jgi:hypothetical protein
MPCDADEANEPFLARFNSRLERAILAQCGFPLDDIDQVVQLQQVDVVDAQALERAVELLLRAFVVARVRLGGDEERPWVPLEP